MGILGRISDILNSRIRSGPTTTRPTSYTYRLGPKDLRGRPESRTYVSRPTPVEPKKPDPPKVQRPAKTDPPKVQRPVKPEPPKPVYQHTSTPELQHKYGQLLQTPPKRQRCGRVPEAFEFDAKYKVGAQFEQDAFDFLCTQYGSEFVFHDVYLPVGEHYTQCDLVLVHQTGIFVMECKDIDGSIYGREYSKNWRVYSRGEEYQIYNPIKQNKSHCGAVARTCHVAPGSVVSIILFSLMSSVKCDELPCEGQAYHMANPETLADKLEELISSRTTWLAPQQIAMVCEAMRRFANPSESVRRAHLDYVQSLKMRSNG